MQPVEPIFEFDRADPHRPFLGKLVAGALALYAATRAVTSARPGPWLVASGLFAGLATLARVDGLLLVVAPAIAWLVLRGWRSPALWAWGVASALVFAAILAPWLVRNAAVFGSALVAASRSLISVRPFPSSMPPFGKLRTRNL